MDDTTKTILLVDDDQFIISAYQLGLESGGYRVLTARDGDQALELIKSERPDLVLLDLIMPRLNGFEVLEALQNDEEVDIPVIVLTNLSQESDEQEARRLGAVDFITKADTSVNQVLLRIQRFLPETTA